ncbi:TetR/AcrR family transcriptional regulator [Lapidilactobacillus luobeiensis]|uniref:TetR/AcrR family transcriptional regulator n=1 Tax=Lapidilactobacillus luobeiensis TaxID=2950371 RepID=UPI0021C30AB5|nr:TetR/AcrR family transcriptional regulator [Lapidilactobacillus luobeiensis]
MAKQRDMSKEKIMATAQEIVIENGFPTLSFRSLARKLDIRSQSLYNYYANIDAVIEDMGTTFMKTLYLKMTENLTGISGKDALRGYANIAHDYFESQGAMVQLLYYVHRYSEESPFVQETGRVLNLLRRVIRHIKLKQMDNDSFEEAFISSVMGYTVIEIMGFLNKVGAEQHRSFQQLIDLYLGEVIS